MAANGKQKKTNKSSGKKQSVSRKTPTLKQKNARESKVVKASNLQWKKVDIPDNLGDYEGFFGLEELDDVEVKIVDGKAEFSTKTEENIKQDGQDSDKDKEVIDKDEDQGEEEKDEKDEDKNVEEQDEDENEDEDEEEFTGFDDDIDGDVNMENFENDIDQDAVEEETVPKQSKNSYKNLANFPLPENIHLPHWEEITTDIPLSKYTLNGLKSLNFDIPTEIQKQTIPLAMQGKDVIGKATTGSGKTLAYGIPIMERYIASLSVKSEDDSIKPPTGVIFCPTRELAHQVVDHLTNLAKFSPLAHNGIVSVTGGLAIQKQERLLAQGPGIFVCTPGRFLELLQKDPELTSRVANTDMIVLDEADRLLQDGHFEEFEKIIEILNKARPKSNSKSWKWQTLVFSATFAKDLFSKLNNNNSKNRVSDNNLMDNEEIVTLLSEKLRFKDKYPTFIDANPKEVVAGNVTEALVECGALERDLYLYYFLLMYPGTTLVFANSIDSVKRLVPFLNNLKIPAFSIHSSMIQRQRLRALEKFRQASENNETSVLVATDVAARGLDIPNIDHVAHYHLPRSADIYIHRSGRTARAGNEGVSVMFCSPQEASGPLRKLRRVVANNKGTSIHSDVKLLPIELEIVSKIKKRAAISAKLADSTVSNTSTKKEETWVSQAAKDLGIDELSDVEEFEDDMLKKQRVRKEKKLLTKEEQQKLRFELKELLATQIRKNTRRSYITSGIENFAHQMTTGEHHDAVLGQPKVNALQDLKKSKSAKVNKPGINKNIKLQQIQKAKKEKKDAKRKEKDARRKAKEL